QGELDQIAYNIIEKYGATPAFLGHPKGSKHPFPATITASVNEELVHGIPGDRVLQDGDIVSLDCGTIYKGWVSDSAFTWPVGQVTEDVQKLLEVTESSLYKAIDQCMAGNRLGDVSSSVQRYIEPLGYNVVRQYGGHGVGRKMWEEPHIPNWGDPGKGIKLRRGMVFAVEPMVMIGGPEVEVLDDHWTIVTADRQWCAHFEHTIAVTENGPDVLTKMD
ncbi:MAG: type I methionyl aminopeptidase, partial [Chloroflexi bacterium]|nr:type I methionyl aminopeptidase [Chloroflexota bacterium]